MPEVRAFIVEDSHVITENLVAALEEMTTVRVVGTAVDEASACVWLKDHHGDCELVIIDIFLKSGNGLGVLKAANEFLTATRLVVLTNYATPAMRAKCLELGATKVYDKSNELDNLVEFCAGIGKNT